MSRILIACGGTGGHLAPGIAIAEILQKRGHHCVLLISQKQVDSVLIEKYGHLNFYKTPGRAFAGGISTYVASAWSLVSGITFSRKLIREEKPDLVLLFGGFLSVGLALAARMSGIPAAVHEANCCPGKAVRLIRRLATRVYLPDGVRMKGVPPERIRYFGYPVRSEIKHCLKAEAWRRMEIEVPNRLLVIIGGSQGASALNEWAVENFETLAEAGISLYCVTGLGKSSRSVIEHIRQDGSKITATFIPFSDRMGDVVSSADLIVSRAGAGAIAEITRCRAPSILIPYPYAADDHQMANALMHERHGAGMVVAQDALETLLAEVKDLMFNDWLLSKFKANLERLDRCDSGALVADDLEALAKEHTLKERELVAPIVL